MAGLKRTYRIVDGNGRIYLPKSVREEAGMHPGDIIEAYVRAAVRQMPDKSRVSLLAELADLMQKDEG